MPCSVESIKPNENVLSKPFKYGRSLSTIRARYSLGELRFLYNSSRESLSSIKHIPLGYQDNEIESVLIYTISPIAE